MKINIIEYLKRNIVTILTIIVILLTITNTKIKNFIIKSLGGYTEIVETTTIDTLEIKVDTTAIINYWVKANAQLFEPKIVKQIITEYDTIKIDTGNIIIPIDNIVELYSYSNSISDSLIDGNINTFIDFNNNKIVSQNLDYKPKFPIIITKTIPIIKTVTQEYKNPYNIGIGGKLTTLGDYGVIGAYQTNKGWQLQGGYTFSNNTSNYIEVGIIKFF